MTLEEALKVVCEQSKPITGSLEDKNEERLRTRLIDNKHGNDLIEMILNAFAKAIRSGVPQTIALLSLIGTSLEYGIEIGARTDTADIFGKDTTTPVN